MMSVIALVLQQSPIAPNNPNTVIALRGAYDLGRDRGVLDVRGAEYRALVAYDREHLVKLDLGAGLRVDLLDVYDHPSLDFVLVAAPLLCMRTFLVLLAK